MTESERQEWLRCKVSPLYFIHRHVQIYDAKSGVWMPFALWNAQAETLRTILNNPLVVILKARQLGMTWLVLGFALWLMLFRAASTIMLFSRRDAEAVHMLDFRLKGMYKRLPDFLKANAVVKSNTHHLYLSNGSMAMAFPTGAGDSYTATLVIVDEADLPDDLNALMLAVKPTIDGGGRMILLSRVDKSKPLSLFKKIYRAAKQRANAWAPVFLPWYVRPGRDAKWYQEQYDHFMSTIGNLDGLHEQYPATDAEALAPSSSDKRIPALWIEQCTADIELLPEPLRRPHYAGLGAVAAMPGLAIYRLPIKERKDGATVIARAHRYIIGADPAEGNPTSDDSALEIIDRDTGEEVACLAGKYQPEVFAAYIDALGKFFNNADVLVERNNHGHAVLLWLRQYSRLTRLKMLQAGRTEGEAKEGWNTTSASKALMYDYAAMALREEETILHNFETAMQLAMIEGSTLSAPEGMHDDRATAFALAHTARSTRRAEAGIR